MIKEDSNVFAIALWSSKHSWTVSCSGTFSQWGARLCWPHRSMNSFSADWGLGLEENVQLLPTFLIRRSRWSGPGSETGRHRSHHDRWLISAQEDTHLTPLTTHTCRHTATHSDMLDGHRQILSSLPHCVYTSKDHNHTHTHTLFSNRGNASGLLLVWGRLLRLMPILLEAAYSKCFVAIFTALELENDMNIQKQMSLISTVNKAREHFKYTVFSLSDFDLKHRTLKPNITKAINKI